MRLLSRIIFVPIGILVIVLAVGLARGGKSSSSSPNDVHLVSGGAIPTPAATATPDALTDYAAAIRHDDQVLHGLINQFDKDLDAGSLPGGDAFSVSQAASDAEQLPPPPGSDTLFVPITQSLDAIIRSANAALGAAQDGPGSATNATMSSSREGFAKDLAALDTLTAKLPAAPPSTPAGSLSQQMEKSIRDNESAAGDYASLEDLSVSFDARTAVLTLAVNPDDKYDGTGLITHASELTIIAGTAIWSTYPQVQAITVKLYVRKQATEVVSDTYARAAGAGLSYLHLRNQSALDNKVMLCGADHFSVATYIWAQLKDKGCMTSPSK